MAPTDIVKHDLSSDLLGDDVWAAPEAPVPMPDEPSLPDVPSMVNPAVTTRVTVAELRQLPFCSVGKLRVRYVAGSKEVWGSSGWVVAPKAFITAGHCVHKKSSGWIVVAGFCPRFDHACPKPFTVKTVYTLRGWQESADRRYDLAACVVSENFSPKEEPPLPFTTGILPGLRFMALGYPVIGTDKHPDFNGERMWKSIGDTVGMVDGRQGAANELTHGASGGPWWELNDKAVSGVNGSRTNDPSVILSPFFSNGGFQNLYDAVKNA